MIRCFTFLLPAMLIAAVANAQLVNNGAVITVQSGATIKCTGAIINNSGGSIQNAGTVSSDGELRNEVGGTLSGAGTYEATTKFVNYGAAFTGLNLKLIGNVNTDSIKSGVGSTYTNVNLAKGAGNTATISDAMTVNGAITFENDNNRLILEDDNLIMGSAATFVSADDNEFVVTNNTGTVTKQALASTSFTYEVGFAAGQYNPLSIANTGTSDNISVRCLQNVLAQGLTGAAVTGDFANNSWVVTEAVAGGSNLQLIGGWAASDELSNFNRNKVGIARYNTGTDWDLPASNVLAASGSGPYTRNRSGVTSVGVFAIADLEKVNAAKLALKVFLQGPYSGTTMSDLLRSRNGVPIIQPYNAAMGAGFTRVGVYDGSAGVNETLLSASVLDVTDPNDDIVDWVYLSLNDAATPATKLQTRAALIQRDGDVVEFDPVSATFVPVRMPIDADGNYHIVIGHRNHLAVRTSVSQLLQDNVTTSYNFSTAQSQAFQNTTTPPIPAQPAMKDLGGGVFGLWAGNVKLDNQIRATGGLAINDYTTLINTILAGNFNTVMGTAAAPVYHVADVNLDGIVRATGGLAINDYTILVNSILLGNFNTVYTQHQ